AEHSHILGSETRIALDCRGHASLGLGLAPDAGGESARRLGEYLLRRARAGSASRQLHGATDGQRQEPNATARRQARPAREVTRMQFSFTVGVNEQHRVDFSFDQFIGNLEIKVDGQTAIKDFRFASLKLTKRYELMVGIDEKHHV